MKNNLIFFYFASFVLVWAFHASTQALPAMNLPCLNSVHQASLEQWRVLLQQISLAGGRAKNFTFPGYKNERMKDGFTDEQMRQQFSGAGEFHCGGYTSSANFVFRNDLLVLAAHSFFQINENHMDCVRRFSAAELENCYVQPVRSNGSLSSDKFFINPESLRMDKHFCQNRSIVGNDWAVVELKNDPKIGPPDVMTYDLYDVEKLQNDVGAYFDVEDLKITNVSAVTALPDEHWQEIPSICDGKMGWIKAEHDSTGQRHFKQAINCSAGPGSSGSGIAVMIENERPHLIGIVTQGQKKSHDNKKDEDGNHAWGPFIEGDFRKAILDCEQTCPKLENASN